MIIVTGEVRFGDGEIERLKDALATQRRMRRGPRTGCERYAYAVDLADPNLLHDRRGMARRGGARRPYAAPHHGRADGARSATPKIEAISIKAYEAHFLQNVARRRLQGQSAG